MKSLLLPLLLLSPLIFGSGSDSDLLLCRSTMRGIQLLKMADSKFVADYSNLEDCEKARGAASEGVVCVWFTPDMPIGAEGWKETGWRPMNEDTKLGLGRRPMENLESCLQATLNSNGGVVCTNTGLGFKGTHTETNRWCGASSQLSYCLEATAHAKDHTVCSFPSDGTGAEAGWVRTKITSECEYQGQQQALSACNQGIQ